MYIEEMTNTETDWLEYGCILDRLRTVGEQGCDLANFVENEGLREALRDCFSSVLNYCENMDELAKRQKTSSTAEKTALSGPPEAKTEKYSSES